MLPWELPAKCTSSQLTRLIAYYQLVPLPEVRADWRTALATAVAAAPWRDDGKVVVKDYLLDFEAEEKQSQEMAWKAFMGWGQIMYEHQHGKLAN